MTQEPLQATGVRVIAGRYAVLEEIGRGGMGVVWLAEDRTIGRRVAIKELHLPAGVPDSERAVLEQRVLREARAAGRLNDPSVVTVYDVLQEAGTTYIVMELIQAPTLSAVVQHQGPLPQDTVARLAEQLLSALEAAHAAGVVHRDVKPSNVMMSSTGRVKLTDFGIAQSVDDPKLTSSGILVGSPTYTAPERIKGAEADASSDLWALAAVLFYAVEGHSPFERSSTAATMHAILNEVPYLTRCHGPLASVITGLLNTTPQARLTATQVRGLLNQITSTPPHGEQTVVNAGGYQQTMMAPAMTRAADRPRPPGAGSRRAWVLGAVVVLLAGGFVGGWFVHQAVSADDTGDQAMLPTMTYGPDSDVPEFDLSNRDCADTPLGAGRSISSSSTVDCAESHDFQVFSVYDAFNNVSIDYPADRLTAMGEATCAVLFHSGRVRAEGKDELVYRTLVPNEAAWKDHEDDRPTYCVLSRKDEKLLSGDRVAEDNN